MYHYRVCHRDLKLTDKVDWLVTEPQISSCLCFPRAGIPSAHYYDWPFLNFISFFFFRVTFSYASACWPLWVGVHWCSCLQKPKEGARFPRGGVTGHWEMPIESGT